ncbi:NAD-dependent epimerase/dehydratase [Desulfofarcimen acetoxidans DSM 771]|uniref:NAD-dependent epimerase/dehydratase n=1 Tax=Desulfofarcimen acetoxidans (strain ATCC 49208 / DSM 771 / KCTC 5769 / VKM B-1644 / 5575) TaxID=485916 RepID=C8W2D2_DESAS|nr:NAD-dependent epimerase/dehydratase family protein [Desulfofarcimen acetoxidans]ACV63616.1 NAD-dependent epimerase/dehydratase [Desulfofarcimen acetoxidans DSM 771]
MIKKILVTGGAGFLGSHLCEKLLTEGYQVRILDSFASGRESNLKNIQKNMQLVRGSISDESMVNEACCGVDAVIHTAFPMTIRERDLNSGLVSDVLTGFFNVLKGALNNNALLVYISSIAVYGNQLYTPIDERHPLEPVLLHGALKLSGENFCRVLTKSHGLRAVILRVADIYGPRNTRISVPIRFLRQSLKNELISVYGDGTQSRTYTYVGDFTDAVAKVLSVPAVEGEILNLSADWSISMYELAQMVRDITGSKSEIRMLKDAPVEDRKLLIDNRKIKQFLDFKPMFSMRQGLFLTVEWLKENPDFYSV